MRRFVLATIGLILTVVVNAQTLDAGLDYRFTNGRYDRVFGGQASLLFNLSERFSIGPQLGVAYWHYREQYEFNVAGLGTLQVNNRAAATAPFVGVHANYLFTSAENRLKLHFGLMLQSTVFIELQDLDSSGRELTFAHRIAWYLPITAEYNFKSNDALGFFLRILPGHMPHSEKHKELNYSFTDPILSLGGQLGIRYQFQGKE